MPTKKAPPVAEAPGGAPAPQFDKAIKAVVAAITEVHGRGVVARLGDPGAYLEIKRCIPTGLPALDAAIGCHDEEGTYGLPLGRLIEIFGPESSGKTTLVTHISAAAQRAGILPYKLDVEQSGLAAYDQELGVQGEQALVSQPDTMEEVFSCASIAIETLEKQRIPSLIIWDSLAASPLKAEFLAGFDEEGRMAARAAFLARNLPKLVKRMKSGNVGIIIVNQLRERIGATAYQKQTYSPGGRALRHWSHLRIEMTPMGGLKREVGGADVFYGMKTKARIVKSKVSYPHREAHLEIHYNPSRMIDPAEAKVRKPMKVKS